MDNLCTHYYAHNNVEGNYDEHNFVEVGKLERDRNITNSFL